MQIKRIMVCLDGSQPSLKGLNHAISIAKQINVQIIGINSDTRHGIFTAINTPKIPEKDWSGETKKILKNARKKAEKNNVKFEGMCIAGRSAGIDLTTFANNPKNRVNHIVIGARGLSLPKEIFLGSTSNFVIHKANPPVTIVK